MSFNLSTYFLDRTSEVTTMGNPTPKRIFFVSSTKEGSSSVVCAQTYPQCYTVLAADLYQFWFERGQIKVDMRTSGSELVPTLTLKQNICQASQKKPEVRYWGD